MLLMGAARLGLVFWHGALTCHGWAAADAAAHCRRGDSGGTARRRCAEGLGATMVSPAVAAGNSSEAAVLFVAAEEQRKLPAVPGLLPAALAAER